MKSKTKVCNSGDVQVDLVSEEMSIYYLVQALSHLTAIAASQLEVTQEFRISAGKAASLVMDKLLKKLGAE